MKVFSIRSLGLIEHFEQNRAEKRRKHGKTNGTQMFHKRWVKKKIELSKKKAIINSCVISSKWVKFDWP